MELGGNNALIVAPSADIDMATQSIFFGAVGTAGQRCTSTRRVIMHESVASKVRRKLLAAYKSLAIGNPLDRKTVMGPLIDKNAVDLVQHSIQRLKDEGGEVLYGGERLTVPGGCYMKPCLATAKPGFEIVRHETSEIGGAFGGEKNTGGGRESGSDCWKSYMRRQTNTINFSTELPLAQGIQFGAGEGSGTA